MHGVSMVGCSYLQPVACHLQGLQAGVCEVGLALVGGFGTAQLPSESIAHLLHQPASRLMSPSFTCQAQNPAAWRLEAAASCQGGAKH